MPQHPQDMSIVRILIILALLGFGLVESGMPRPAAAAAATITVSRGVAPPGASMMVKGSGFQQGDRATLSVVTTGPGPASRRVTSAGGTVGSGGSFTVTLTVPRGTAFGTYAVLASDSHNNTASALFQVPLEILLASGKSGPHVYPIAGLHLLVTGTGFKSGESTNLQASFPLYGGGTRKESKSVTADKKGNLGPVGLQVPPQARDGDVSLTATGQQSGKAGMVTATLTVVHKPFLLPASQQVTAGQSLEIAGGGFVPGEQVAVSTTIARTDASGVTLVKTVRAGGQGTIRFDRSLPKDTRPGTYTITATGATGHFQASTRVSVKGAPAGPKATPSPGTTATKTPPAHVAITVAPLSVIPGADAQVRGTGFTPGTQVSVSSAIHRSNGSTQTVQATGKADGKGAFLATLHTPGDAAGGTYAVTAKGTDGRTASQKLVISVLKTSVVVVPALAVPGTAVTINGFGFSSRARVTVFLAGQALGVATADSAGNFKVSLKIPGNRATGMYTLTAQESNGRKASIGLRLYRHISTHFYFASLYTGSGFRESLLFVNTSEIAANVRITYQLTSGAPRSKSISIPPHSHVAHDVNGDLGGGVNASAVIATDVPISAERMVLHGQEGSLDPGTSTPSKIWYFANGNTSHQYQEYIAVQNPTNSPAQITVQVQPTHSRTFYLHRNMPPQSRTTWHLNSVVHDAIGVIVTASAPIVANRTIFIHRGLTSKTGVAGPQTHWYFAAGPKRGGTRHWIGVINTTNRASYMTLRAYNAQGTELATIKRRLRPYAREGYLMNQYAGETDVAVVVTTSQPSISEQSTFLIGSHDAHTDSFGVTTFHKTAEFAEATTWTHQDNLLAVFNPNLAPVPVVVQFLNTHGGTAQRTYVVPPLAHELIDVGRVVPNSQLGILVASDQPFVVLDRQIIDDGAGAMTSLGTQS